MVVCRHINSIFRRSSGNNFGDCGKSHSPKTILGDTLVATGRCWLAVVMMCAGMRIRAREEVNPNGEGV